MVTGTAATNYPLDAANQYFSGTYQTNISQSAILEKEEKTNDVQTETEIDAENGGNNTSDFIQSDEETQPCQAQDQELAEWCKNKEPLVFPSQNNLAATQKQFESLDQNNRAFDSEQHKLPIFSSEKKAKTQVSSTTAKLRPNHLASVDQLSLFANHKITLANALVPMSDESPSLLLSDHNTDEITPETANPQTNDEKEMTRTEKTQSLKSPHSPDI